MNDLFCIQMNDSARQEENVGLNSFTIPSTTHHHQHHQVSQTIFLCVKSQTPSENEMNIEVIDISDDECKNGTSIDDSSDEDEIEVIQLSDDEGENEVNDEPSGENMTVTMSQHKQPVDFDSSAPSTSQIEHENHSEDEDTVNGIVHPDRVLITLGLTCSECSKLICTRSKLEQHWIEKHRKLFFKCMIRGCNRQFVNRSLLSQHYANHESTNHNTKWNCAALDCHFEKSTQKSLTAHVYMYHEKGLFRCSLCLVQHPYRFMVNNHYRRTHKRPQNKIFACPVDTCHFVSGTKYQLKLHQLTHTQLRPFRCTWPHCDYAANYRGNVVQHIRGKHLNIPVTIKEAAQINVQCTQKPNPFVVKIPF